jgi:hypothetical protein
VARHCVHLPTPFGTPSDIAPGAKRLPVPCALPGPEGASAHIARTQLRQSSSRFHLDVTHFGLLVLQPETMESAQGDMVTMPGVPAFSLTERDRHILSQTDEEYHLLSWDELKTIICTQAWAN